MEIFEFCKSIGCNELEYGFDSPYCCNSQCKICQLNEWIDSRKCKAGKSILDEADKIINGERQDTYGKPEDSFQIIADFWAGYLKQVNPVSLNAMDVAHMMALFKIARTLGQKPDRDNYRDAIGYLAIAADRLSND